MLRDARVLAGLTAEEAADKAGLKRGAYGNMERGRQGGKPGGYHPEPALVARAASALGVTAAQMEAAGRGDVADILRADAPALPRSRPALALVPDELGDELVEAWIERPDVPDHDRRVLRMLWRQTDPEGKLLPRDTRVRALVDWRQNYMANAGGRAAGAPSEARDAPGNAS